MRHVVKVLRGESGQMLIMVAVSVAVLLGFVAFAADMGMLFRAQRNMQIAADAAAVAGALDYKYNGSLTSCQSAGIAAATANGVTASSGGPTVTVNCPPKSGPASGDDGYAEAIVSAPSSTLFMGLFGKGSVTTAARAVAGAGTTAGCIWALGTSGVDIPITGSGSINVPTCGVYDNSNASDALDLTGSGSIEAESIGIVGNDPGYADSGSGHIEICNPTCTSSKPTTGISPVSSPITLSAPQIPTGTATTPASYTTAYTCSGTSNCTVSPGNYKSITNNSTGTLTFSAGTYNVTGNIANNSSGSIVSGSGTYIFNVGGSITDSGAAMTLGDGTYNVVGNITNSGSGTMTFGGNSTVNGTISASGSGSLNLDAGDYIINGSLTETGSGALTLGAGNYTIASNFSDTSSGALTIGSGLIITEGNLSLTGSSSLTATSDTFFTEGSTSVTGSGSMDITAPTSGTYNGIVFYMPSNDNKSISLSGSGSATMEGIVYAPDAPLTITGSGSGNVYMDFIVDSLTLTGSGSLNDKQYQLINSSALNGKIVMVE